MAIKTNVSFLNGQKDAHFIVTLQIFFRWKIKVKTDNL